MTHRYTTPGGTIGAGGPQEKIADVVLGRPRCVADRAVVG